MTALSCGEHLPLSWWFDPDTLLSRIGGPGSTRPSASRPIAAKSLGFLSAHGVALMSDPFLAPRQIDKEPDLHGRFVARSPTRHNWFSLRSRRFPIGVTNLTGGADWGTSPPEFAKILPQRGDSSCICRWALPEVALCALPVCGRPRVRPKDALNLHSFPKVSFRVSFCPAHMPY